MKKYLVVICDGKLEPTYENVILKLEQDQSFEQGLDKIFKEFAGSDSYVHFAMEIPIGI